MDLEKVTKIAEKIPDLALNLGVMYWGYKAAKHPMGAVYAGLGYKLATNTGGASHIPNVSRVMGLAILGTLGLTSLTQATKDDDADPVPDPPPIEPGEGQVTTTVSACLNMGGIVIQTLDTYSTPQGPVTTCICQLPTDDDNGGNYPPKKQYTSIAECVADGNDVWYCKYLLSSTNTPT